MSSKNTCFQSYAKKWFPAICCWEFVLFQNNSTGQTNLPFKILNLFTLGLENILLKNQKQLHFGSFCAKSTRAPDMTISDFDKNWYGSFWA